MCARVGRAGWARVGVGEGMRGVGGEGRSELDRVQEPLPARTYA